MTELTLSIDLRESKKDIDAFRAFVPDRFPDWKVDVRLMEVGDYAVGDKLGVERKRPPDFIGSLQSGRLFQQAEELAESYEKAFIVVDGVPRNLWSDPYARLTPQNAMGACASLAMRRGTPVLFTGRKPEHFMLQVMKLAEKSQGVGSFVYNPIRRQGSKKERGLHLIAGLPGVGPKRAKVILDEYGSPLNALQNYEEWKNVNGIGTGTIEKVREVLDAPAD